jgi:hypothetical protein
LIINTGQRTDIPAFYSQWLCRRIEEGYVLVRNPYYPQQVTRYGLDPQVVDLIAFCTKNPAPMLPHLPELSAFRMLWHVTITPYGKDIEPHVPAAQEVMQSFCQLSDFVGKDRIVWRYDPILITEKYSLDFHIRAFAQMCGRLQGKTNEVIISFLDLYRKTRNNFPEGRTVSWQERAIIGEAFSRIAAEHGMRLAACNEGTDMEAYHADCSGCMTREKIEKAFHEELAVPSGKTMVREGCRCLLGNDIGAYNSCGHGCRYCYANENQELVRRSMQMHDPDSPFLIGHAMPGDIVHEAKQQRWFTGQMLMNL